VRGHPQIVQALNEILTADLTAINQYYIHYKMCENWGYSKLANKKREESLEEMRDADRVIERVLYLGGMPNMQRLSPVRIGEDPIEQHRLDLDMELAAVKRLNEAIALAREQGDNGTRHLLEEMLGGEESSVEWLEAQLGIVEKIGAERYLAEQL
jgi:bacterioferritin